MFAKKLLSHQYIKFTYPADHWALGSTKEGTCIAFVSFKDKYNYAVKLNPTDRRGYRALITYVGTKETEIQSTFNRPYDVEEQKGLSEVTALMVEIYKKLDLPIVQTAQAGNNSHALDETSGITQIGNQKEPSMLHTHVWGRGNPKQDYIPGVPLEGPKPGEMFDMMAKTPSVKGNEQKVKWDKNQLELGLNKFKQLLNDYQNSQDFKRVFAADVKINIYQPLELYELAKAETLSSNRLK